MSLIDFREAHSRLFVLFVLFVFTLSPDYIGSIARKKIVKSKQILDEGKVQQRNSKKLVAGESAVTSTPRSYTFTVNFFVSLCSETLFSDFSLVSFLFSSSCFCALPLAFFTFFPFIHFCLHSSGIASQPNRDHFALLLQFHSPIMKKHPIA